MRPIPVVPVLLLALGLALPVRASGLLKPLPEVDTAALSAAARAELSAARAEFERVRPQLVGPYLASAYVQLAALYAQNGYVDAALVAVGNARELVPDDARYAYLAGVFHLQQNRLREAEAAFAAAFALDAEYLPIRYRLASARLAIGDYAGARKVLEPLARDRVELAPAHALLAEIAMREKRPAEAVAHYRRALAAAPSATRLNAQLAEALAAAGDRAGAEAARQRAGEGSVSYPDPLLEAMYARPRDPAAEALALAADGRHGEALALLDAALAEAPGDARLLAAYARVEADRGRIEAAVERVGAALAAAPGDAQALLARGMVHEMAGRDAAALADYQAAVRADLALGAARLALGNALMRGGRAAEAAEQYRAVAQAAGGIAWARLAAALHAAGRCADALREINGALRAAPRDGGLMQVFVRLAASCPAASAEERAMAYDYGRALYRQRPDEDHSEALALAAAAAGDFEAARDYQAQAMFEATKRGDRAAVARMRGVLDGYRQQRAAAAPWPSGHPFLVPPRLEPSQAGAAAR